MEGNDRRELDRQQWGEYKLYIFGAVWLSLTWIMSSPTSLLLMCAFSTMFIRNIAQTVIQLMRCWCRIVILIGQMYLKVLTGTLCLNFSDNTVWHWSRVGSVHCSWPLILRLLNYAHYFLHCCDATTSHSWLYVMNGTIYPVCAEIAIKHQPTNQPHVVTLEKLLTYVYLCPMQYNLVRPKCSGAL